MATNPKTKNYRDLIGKRQERTFVLTQRDLVIDADKRTVELAFASETPVKRWFGEEILDCSPGAVMLERLNAGGALLSDHNSRGQVGAVVRNSARADNDKICRATAKFSRRQSGEEEFQDVLDEIRTNVSVGYVVHEYRVDNDTDTYTATRWEPVEISLVSIPADLNVGVGRSSEKDEAGKEPEQETPQPAASERADEPAPTPIQVRSQPMPELTAIEKAQARSKEFVEFTQFICREFKVTQERTEELTGMAREFALAGKTIEELGASIQEKRAAWQAKTPAAAPIVDLSERDRERYSISRMILADAGMRTPAGDRRESGALCFEDEVSQAIEKKLEAPGYKRRGGFFMPTGIPLGGQQQRAGLDTQTATAGQELVSTEIGSFIELLRNRAMVVALGATVLPGLQGNVSFPKQTGAGTFFWVSENPGVDVADSDLTLDQVTLSPKTGQSSTSFSRQLLRQSVVNIDNIVQNDLVRINALAIDRAAIHGTGANNQPTGVYAQTGVNAVAMGGAVTFAKLVEMETAIAAANADIGSMAYLTTPNIRGKAKQIPIVAGEGLGLLWVNGELNGYRAEASNQVSKTLGAGAEHGIVFAVWSEMLIGEWGALEIITDPYRLKKQGMIEVTSFIMVDIALRYPEAFAKGTGLTAA